MTTRLAAFNYYKIYKFTLKNYHHLYFIALFNSLYTEDIFFEIIIITNFSIAAIIININKRSKVDINKELDILINKNFFINIPALKGKKKRVVFKVSSTKEDNNSIKE